MRILLKNGKIIDGTGEKARKADILIEDGLIVDIGSFDDIQVDETLDITDRIVSPGFIDMHSHADVSLPCGPNAESYIYQGITTIVMGQCGFSIPPILPDTKEVYLKSTGLDEMPVDPDQLASMGSYLEYLKKQGIAINAIPLVGHGTIRGAVMGFSPELPDENQLKKMVYLSEKAMDEGAVGISTGLIYPPGYYSNTEELIAVTMPFGKRDGYYFSHVRGESAELIDSINEEIEIGKATGASLQHSHYKAAGEENWHLSSKGLERIDQARDMGLDMTVDMYPYTASSNGLIDALPDWTRAGGIQNTLDILNNKDKRQKITAEIGNVDWSKNLISGTKKEEYVGKFVSDLAEKAGKDSFEWVYDALIETNGDISRIVFGMSDENVKSQLQYEHMMIGTDGYGFGETEFFAQFEQSPHPRSFGTFPRVLGKYVREEGVLTIEQAIRMMTGKPAEKMRLSDRGFIKKGYKADLVIFDPENVIDRATFEKPKQYPAGIDHVIVNGKFVVKDAKKTNLLPGEILGKK